MSDRTNAESHRIIVGAGEAAHEDELDRVRRHREEAWDIVRRHVDEVPYEELLLQQIRSPWNGTVQYATMLSCTRLGHPTAKATDPPEAPCVCRWRK